ncbi:MAG: type II secretion system protein GspL [Gammaproteobacteria bacterium]
MSLRLLLLPEAADGTATCLELDAAGQVRARSRPTAQHPLPAPAAGVRELLAVPATATRIALLPQPAHSQAQARAAALRLFADDIALDGTVDGMFDGTLHTTSDGAFHGAAPDRTPDAATATGKATDPADADAGERAALHVAVSEPLPDGSRIAVATAVGCMRRWLAHAATLGMQEAQAVVPDALLLPPPDGTTADEAPADGAGWQVVLHDGRWLVRGPDGLAFSAEPALAARLLPAAAPPPLSDPDRVQALLARGALRPVVDLRQDRFALAAGSGGRGARRRLAVAAAALLVSPLLLLVAGGLRDQLAARDLQARAAARVEAALPGSASLPATAPAEARTAAALAALHAGERTAADLGALAAAVVAGADSTLESLHYDVGQWRIEISHPASAPPQALLDALAAAGMPAHVLETRPRGAGFGSTLVPARAGGSAP